MKKVSWYLSIWFICLWFVFSFFIVPFFVGLILFILRVREEKKIQNYWEESGFSNVVDARREQERIQEETVKLQTKADKDLEKANQRKLNIEENLEKILIEVKQKQDEIIILDDELLFQSFGFYDTKYDLEDSEQYKLKLDEVKKQQKEMVKNKIATDHSDEWQLDGSKQKGRVMNNNNIKLTLRSFNNECDAAIRNVKFNNINSMEKRINSTFKQLNNINKRNRIAIKEQYLALKLDELYLAYEYAQKREEEKEEQREIREQMREEKRVQQEVDRQRKKLEKDEKHHQQALSKYQKQLKNASDELKKDIEEKMQEVMGKMEELKKERESVDYREKNARAGYVYIISNIGAFGEDIYKIGMTRRLEPDDRIRELGSASVPFGYDVHAMIFSDDAPGLETELHREFNDRRFNLVNMRKEFFHVTLEEIERIVKEKHNKVVEFTKLAEAEEWRKSEQIRKERSKLVSEEKALA